MPLGAWLTLPRSAWLRMRSAAPLEPWLAPPAVRYLDRVIRHDWEAVEFGSGRSTIWLAQRCRQVISFESSPSWYESVLQWLKNERLFNVHLRLLRLEDFHEELLALPDAAFDLIVVDNDEEEAGQRLLLASKSRPKLKRTGLLLLDDSDRSALRAADDVLAGWQAKRFIGVRPFPFMATETSIYRQPRQVDLSQDSVSSQ